MRQIQRQGLRYPKRAERMLIGEVIIITFRLMKLSIEVWIWMFLICLKIMEWMLRSFVSLLKFVYGCISSGRVRKRRSNLFLSMLQSVGQIPFKCNSVECILIQAYENTSGNIELNIEENASGQAYIIEINSFEAIKLLFLREI